VHEAVSKSGDSTLFAEMRTLLRKIFFDALAASTVERAFEQHLDAHRGVLRVKDDVYDLRSYSRVFAIALGKASLPMAEALHRQLGSSVTGIVIQPESFADQPMLHGFTHFNGGHPTPSPGSLKAAQAVLKSLGAQADDALILYLLSGGGSALMEKPLDDELTLDDLIATHRALVHCGAPIGKMNAIRKHLSAVKGGRLALAASEGGARQQVSIMVSDVPDSTPDALASGPTMPDPTTVEECYAIAKEFQLLTRLPSAVRELFEHEALQETPKYEDGTFHTSRWWTILSNPSLEEAAKGAAEQAGFNVAIDNSCDDWDYARAADYLLNRLRELHSQGRRTCLISGGEVTVKVPHDASGVGGRNQHFALYAASRIANQDIAVLSGGSDGVDGNSSAAGAIADGSSRLRAQQAGADLNQSLANFDSFSLFERLSDGIITGPTGNNIRDLRILLAW